MSKKETNKNYIQKYHFELSIALVIFGIFILPRIPYVNLLFNYLIIIIVFLATLLMVGFKGASFLKIGVALFSLMLLLTLSRDNFIVEHVANIAYFILFFGSLLLVRETMKKD
jgi:hypothetical protein